MPQIDTDTAAEVRAALARHRVDDNTLASWLNVSRSTASRKKHGRSPFTLVELHTIGVNLELDYRQFFPADSSVPSATAYAVTR